MAAVIICEFNPFHNGHKYLIQQARNLTNEPVIAVMSGSFVQRGEAAVSDKFSRAAAALENGADLVLELPVVYAVSCAERFAKAGTFIAKSFECADYIVFGCENDDTAMLKAAYEAKKNPEVNRIIKLEMESGNYYPRALYTAVERVYGEDTAKIFEGSNNILAVEYLSGIADSRLKPVAVKRIGAEHNSDIYSDSIASASYIRKMIRNGEDVFDFVPSIPDEITYPKNLERAMLYKLRTMSKAQLAELPEVSEGLENRIYDAVHKYTSIEEIIKFIKTKRYTYSRISRIFACALLDITEKMQNIPIEYVRVLGFTKDGAKLLKSCKLNVVTSAANGMKAGGNISALLEKDIYAADVAALAYNDIKKSGLDYTAQIIKV